MGAAEVVFRKDPVGLAHQVAKGVVHVLKAAIELVFGHGSSSPSDAASPGYLPPDRVEDEPKSVCATAILRHCEEPATKLQSNFIAGATKQSSHFALDCF